MSNSLLKSSAIYGLGAFLTKAFGFFLIPLYTRFLTLDEYGALSLLNQILQLASYIFLLGVSTSCMRYYFNREADAAYREQLYGNGIMLVLFLPAVLCIMLGPLAYIVVDRFLPSIPFFPYVMIILAVALFTPMVTLMAGLLRVQERAKAYVTFYIAFFIVQMATIAIAIGVLGYGLKGQLVAQLITNFVFWILALLILKQNARFSFSPDITNKLLLFGIPVVPFLIFSWINTASGRFMLERYTSLADVGIFALAFQFAGLVALFATAVDSAVMPHYYKTANREDAARLLGTFVSKYVVFFGAAALMAAIFVEPMILVMADRKYFAATQYVPLLVFGSWLTIVTNTFTWSLMHSKRTGILAAIRAMSAVLMVCFLVLFLKYFEMGIYGVAYAIILVNVFIIGISFVVAQMYFRLVFPVLSLASATLLVLAGFGAVEYFTKSTPGMAGFIQKLVIAAIIAYVTLRIARIRFMEYLLMRKL